MWFLNALLTTFAIARLSTAVPYGSVAPGQLGAVSSENYICSQIGTGLLEAGGNAADAVGDFYQLSVSKDCP